MNNDFEVTKTTVYDCINSVKEYCRLADNPNELKFIFISDNGRDWDIFSEFLEYKELKYTFFEDNTQLMHGVENILIMTTNDFKKLSNYNFNIVNRSVVLAVIN